MIWPFKTCKHDWESIDTQGEYITWRCRKCGEIWFTGVKREKR